MAKTLKYTSKYGYPRVDNKVKITKAPLIGFEWEVPIDYCTFDTEAWEDYYKYDEEAYGDVLALQKYSNANSFDFHTECGCMEFASPVGNTVSVARRIAKGLIEAVDGFDFLTTEDTTDNMGGIHVSVGDADGSTPSDTHYRMIDGMLNRESSYRFIWKFSGRGEQEYQHEDYLEQGMSSCWDADRDNEDFYGSRNDMLRPQYGLIEFRLWANFPEYLIPAIEFTHSVYRFTKNKKKIPYLRDYKKWLFKQPGYKTLKQFDKADWSLIE